MSGEGKRSDWPSLKPPRPSSTLLRHRGDHPLSCSIEPAPPAEVLARPLSGLEALPAAFAAMSGANLQPDRMGRQAASRRAGDKPARASRAAVHPPGNPEMAPQAIGKTRFAEGNDASLVALPGDEPASDHRFRGANDQS